LAHHDNTLLPNDNDSSILPLIALSAKNNPDTLHFGDMQQDPDRPKFEADMQHTVQDLLDNNCIAVVPRSSYLLVTHLYQQFGVFNVSGPQIGPSQNGSLVYAHMEANKLKA
jgi:hypothetical protein